MNIKYEFVINSITEHFVIVFQCADINGDLNKNPGDDKNMMKWDFYKLSKILKCSFLFITSTSQDWYCNCEEDLKTLKTKLFEEYSPIYIVTLGGSMGGFGSILHSKLFNADLCLAFCPQTNLNSSFFEKYDDEIPLYGKISYQNTINYSQNLDLRYYINKNCKYHIFYGTLNDWDKYNAINLKTSNVTLHNYHTDEHNICIFLKRINILYDLIIYISGYELHVKY